MRKRNEQPSMEKNVSAVIFSLLAVASVVFVLVNRFSADAVAQTVLSDLLIFLCFAVTLMARTLKRTLKEDFYSYENIGLFGGILFASTFIIALAAYFLSCLADRTRLSVEFVFRRVVEFPQLFSLYIVPVICVFSLLITVSNIALIRHEGFRTKNLLGVVLGGLYVGGTVLIYAVDYLLYERVFKPNGITELPAFRAAYVVLSLFVLIMLCYFETILAGACVMEWKAVRRKAAYDKDFIMILGCSIDRKGGLLPLLKGRTNRAIHFGWEQEIQTGKKVIYVPTGGKGQNEIMSEGSAMEMYLLSHSVEQYEILPEKQSANTWENMCFSKKLMDSVKPEPKVAFTTTNYHIFRSGMLARKAGLDAEGVVSETKWYFWPNGFIREFFAILKMNTRAHLKTAVITAAVCILIGGIGLLGGLL